MKVLAGAEASWARPPTINSRKLERVVGISGKNLEITLANRNGDNGLLLRTGNSHRFQNARGMLASPHYHASGTRNLEDGVIAFAENLDEAFDFCGDPGDLEHERFGREIDDSGASLTVSPVS